MGRQSRRSAGDRWACGLIVAKYGRSEKIHVHAGDELNPRNSEALQAVVIREEEIDATLCGGGQMNRVSGRNSVAGSDLGVSFGGIDRKAQEFDLWRSEGFSDQGGSVRCIPHMEAGEHFAHSKNAGTQSIAADRHLRIDLIHSGCVFWMVLQPIYE
jgi:hypothetical protein